MMKRFIRHERALERKLDRVIELLEEQNKLLLTIAEHTR
tara:strand:+ start:233 stop:349 length:117 start_codon:yes stop_codon:yes gene_type:complete